MIADFWTCGFCTFDNAMVMPQCEMCQNPKPEEVKVAPETSSAPAQSKWSCPMCTFENEANDNKCDMCQSDRPAEPEIRVQSEAEESKQAAAASENRQSNRQSLQIIDTTSD